MDDGDAARHPGLHMVLLGGFRLARGPVSLPVPASGTRLLALLGLDEAVERTLAAERLWPDLTPQRAHANVRTTLWRLHRAQAGLVLTSGELLELAPRISVDARAVERWALEVIRGEAVRGPGRDGPQEPPGEPGPPPPSAGRALLPGWDEPWLLEHRERLHLLQLQAFETHARHMQHAGRYAEAIVYAFRALQLDALRESAARLMVEIHVQQGNRAEAIRFFERFRATLRRELGVEPGPALAAAIPRARPRLAQPR